MRLLKKRIGERIKALRKSAGYPSQAAFAEAIGVEQSTVARWESGRFMPLEEQLDNMATILNVSKSIFLDDDFSPSKKSSKPADIIEKIEALESRIRSLESPIEEREVEVLRNENQSLKEKILSLEARVATYARAATNLKKGKDYLANVSRKSRASK